MTVMITLNKLYSVLSYDNWKKVREVYEHLDLDTPFPLSSVLDSNGLEYTLYGLEVLPAYIEIPKRFALWCAREVQNLMTSKHAINSLRVAERYLDGDTTLEKLKTAHHVADIAYYAFDTIRYASDAVGSSNVVDTVRYAAATARCILHITDLDMKQKQIDKLREMLDAA